MDKFDCLQDIAFDSCAVSKYEKAPAAKCLLAAWKTVDEEKRISLRLVLPIQICGRSEQIVTDHMEIKRVEPRRGAPIAFIEGIGNVSPIAWRSKSWTELLNQHMISKHVWRSSRCRIFGGCNGTSVWYNITTLPQTQDWEWIWPVFRKWLNWTRLLFWARESQLIHVRGGINAIFNTVHRCCKEK